MKTWSSQVGIVERRAIEATRMLELIAYCGPFYPNHSVGITLAKEKTASTTTTNVVTVDGESTSAISSNDVTEPLSSHDKVSQKGDNMTGMSAKDDMSVLMTMDKVEELLGNCDGPLPVRVELLTLSDVLSNPVHHSFNSLCDESIWSCCWFDIIGEYSNFEGILND